MGAEVTPSLIRRIAERPDVVRIYLGEEGAPRGDISRVVVQANTVNSRGFTGAGVTVGVVEPDRIGSHPNLPGTQRTLCLPTNSTTISAHKTWVAGVIQSTNATYRGIAPDVTIVDGIAAGDTGEDMKNAMNCVLDAGIRIINISWGIETNGSFNSSFARYVDEKAYMTGASIVVAASNFCSNKIGSPDIAFNVIAVSSFGDNNTADLSDDIAPCTGVVDRGSFLDPDSPNGDREEPDVVAPGHNIVMTANGGGFITESGTSYATPHVTGGVALLSQRQFGLLSKVEEVRAILMASARHNLEGSSRLSDRDGAGGIQLAAADTVLTSSQSDHFFNNGAASNFPISRTFTATDGQRVRVVIAWAHKMPLGQTMTQPTTDLDLEVFCGSNSKAVGGSFSYDNNYEIVEFTATSCPSGYTAKISNFRPSSGDEFIGFAVSKTDF